MLHKSSTTAFTTHSFGVAWPRNMNNISKSLVLACGITYLEFIPKYGLFHKTALLSLKGF